MDVDSRVFLIAILAVTALAGIGLAAEDQVETFLHPQHLDSGFSDSSPVQGALVALTGLLVAFAATLGAMLTSRVGWRQRLLPLFVVFISTYGAVMLLQTAMFSYIAEDLSRSASFAISPILANADATPSTFLGPLALLALCGLGIQTAVRRLNGQPAPRDGTAVQRDWVGASLLATPFLVIAAVGNIRLLIDLPDDQTGTLPYFVILPLLGAAAIGALIVISIKTWHLSAALREPHLAVVADEAWGGLRRIEWALAGAIAGLSLLATLLEAMPSATVEATAFNLNSRTHTQAQVVLVFVLMPLLGMHGRVRHLLGGDLASDPRAMRPVWAYWIVGGLGAALATVLTFTADGALWPWLAIAGPLSIVAIVVLPPRSVMLPALLGATIMWAIGNTVIGTFQLRDQAQLVFQTDPGLLAMWRALAVAVIAVAVARSARGAPGVPRVAAWPMTAGLGAAVAIIVFFELPFSAWIINEPNVEYVGIGTVVASQDAAVRFVMHGLSTVAAFSAGILAARLQRPDWFARPKAMPDLPANHRA